MDLGKHSAWSAGAPKLGETGAQLDERRRPSAGARHCAVTVVNGVDLGEGPSYGAGPHDAEANPSRGSGLQRWLDVRCTPSPFKPDPPLLILRPRPGTDPKGSPTREGG